MPRYKGEARARMSTMAPLRSILTFLLLVTSNVRASSLIINVPQAPSDGVFDPDNILTLEQHTILAERIEDFQVHISAGDENFEVQIAVAVIDRMNLTSLPPDMDDEKGAEKYARHLHDTWGVGKDTDAGGTGVLLFLSIYDRIVYISRGEALSKILTDVRIDSILENIGPVMRQTKFSDGLLLAIDEIQGFIIQGEPNWKEFFLSFLCHKNFVFLGMIAWIVHGVIRVKRQRRQEREYAQAASQLSEIDRAQAEALQGRFQATSCPICLECFKDPQTGSDDQPIRLLRCGHVFDETCWNHWVTSGQGHICKCPICKMDLAQPRERAIINPEEVPINETSAGGGGGNPDVVVRQFQQDRNFRLIQLGTRFPSFITPSQIQRWSSPLYDRSLVRDPVFRQSSPEEVARQSELRRASSTSDGHGECSHSSTSYGGGTSSGGRAGRF